MSKGNASEFDLVINNGKLDIPPDVISSSIGVRGGKIATIGTDLSGIAVKKELMQKETTSSPVW